MQAGLNLIIGTPYKFENNLKMCPTRPRFIHKVIRFYEMVELQSSMLYIQNNPVKNYKQ